MNSGGTGAVLVNATSTTNSCFTSASLTILQTTRRDTPRARFGIGRQRETYRNT
jgi:hypothetical protein